MDTAITYFYETEDPAEELDGWAVIEWKKGPKQVCRVKAVLVAGVWALRIARPDREAYPLYKSSTSWSTIEMVSEEEAQALLSKRPARSQSAMGEIVHTS